MSRKKKPAAAGLCDRHAVGDLTVWERLLYLRPIVHRLAHVPQQYCLPEDAFCYDLQGDEFPTSHGDYSRPWPPFLLFRFGTIPAKVADLGFSLQGEDDEFPPPKTEGKGAASWMKGGFALLMELGPRDVRFRGKAGRNVREIARVAYGESVLAELRALGVGLDDAANPTYLRAHHWYCYRVWVGLLSTSAHLISEALVGDWHLSPDPYRYDLIKLRLADPSAVADRLIIRFEPDQIRILLPRAEKSWDDQPTELRTFSYSDPADTLENFLGALGLHVPGEAPTKVPPGYEFLMT